MRGATRLFCCNLAGANISTHTPHAGRDHASSLQTNPATDFYSHAPCGARHNLIDLDRDTIVFLLTRPMRGATRGYLRLEKSADISTHTPHAGRDGRYYS